LDAAAGGRSLGGDGEEKDEGGRDWESRRGGFWDGRAFDVGAVRLWIMSGQVWNLLM
jgi:hypothetical protein